MSQELTSYSTPIAFKCLSMEQASDGAGTIWGVFQGEKDPNHTKYCRIMRRVGSGASEHWEDVGQVSGIYGEPKIMVNAAGVGIAYGLNRDRSAVVRAEIPGWVSKT